MSHPDHFTLLKDLLRNRPHNSALDVGTGQGQSALALTEYFNRVVGIEISSDAIMAGQSQLIGQKKKLKLKVMNGAVLRFPAKSFDCAASFWSLHHMRLLPRVLAEMYRVLRPGGLFFNVDHLDRQGSARQNNYLYLHKLKIEVEKKLGKEHFNLIMPEDIMYLLKSIGLKDVGFELFLGQPEPSAKQPELTKRALDICDQIRKYLNQSLAGSTKNKFDAKEVELANRLNEIQKKILKIGVETAPYYAVYGFKLEASKR